MDVFDITVDETQAATMRGVSVYTQARHRKLGIGPKPFKPVGATKGWRYKLRDIKAEQDEAEDAA